MNRESNRSFGRGDHQGRNPAVFDSDQAAGPVVGSSTIFAMLIPQFRGTPISYLGADDADITEQMTLAKRLYAVDADYTPKTYKDYRAADWPACTARLFPECVCRRHRVCAAAPDSKPKETRTRPHQSTRQRRAPEWPPASWGARSPKTSPIHRRASEPQHHASPRQRCPRHASPRWAFVFHRFGGFDHHGARRPRLRTLSRARARSAPLRPRRRPSRRLDEARLHSAFLWKLQAKPGWKMIPE